jgi:Phosphotransferase enzyme family
VLHSFHRNEKVWKALEGVQRDVIRESGLTSTPTRTAEEPLELSLLRHRRLAIIALPKRLVTQVLPPSLLDETAVTPSAGLALSSSPSPSQRLWIHPSWSGYLLHLASLRTSCMARMLHGLSLPPHLMIQVEDFLPKLDELHTLLPKGVAIHPSVAATGSTAGAAATTVLLPSALHVDITTENVLGSFTTGTTGAPSWRPSTLIDFADSVLGDPAYEVIAAHCSCFNGDPAVLKAFLRRYEGHFAAGKASEQEKRLAARLGGATGTTSTTTYAFAPMPSLSSATGQLPNYDCYRLLCLLLLHPVDGFRAIESTRPGLIASCADLMTLARALFQ